MIFAFFFKYFSLKISQIFLSSLRFMKEDCFDEPFKTAFEHKKNSRKKCLIALKFLNNIDTKYDLANHRAMLELRLSMKRKKENKLKSFD